MEEKESTLDVNIEELKKKLNTLSGKITTLEEKKDSIVKKAEELIAKTIYEKKQEIEKTFY